MPSHRIKLVLSDHLRRSSDGGGTSCWSKVVDVAGETWTLEKLLKLMVRDFWKGKMDVNNITLSIGTGKDTKTIDWKINPKALVRDVIPKQSSVHCGLEEEEENTMHVSAGNDSMKNPNDSHKENNDSRNNYHPKPAPAETRPSKKAKKESSEEEEDEDVIVLMSDNENENNDGSNLQKIKTKPTAKYPTNTKPTTVSATLDDPRDPTTVMTMDHWIYQQGPARFRQEEVLGKWLVFRNSDAINDTWKTIATAVQSGELHAVSAKVATHYNSNMSNPFGGKKKQQSYVICVYTSQPRIDQVGRLLIPMVQHDIRYKTDEMTMNGVYANTTGTGKASIKTLYWNGGNPDTTRKLWTMTESLKRARKATKETESSFLSFDKVQVTVKALQHHYYKKRDKPDVTNQPVQLERERTNTYDKNAIYVVLGGGSGKLGYLAKDHAAILAPWMDRNLIQLDGSKVVSVARDRESATLELKGRAHPQAQEMWQCFA